jgi:hypothetical protein
MKFEITYQHNGKTFTTKSNDTMVEVIAKEEGV